jgi:hypothetical protein
MSKAAAVIPIPLRPPSVLVVRERSNWRVFLRGGYRDTLLVSTQQLRLAVAFTQRFCKEYDCRAVMIASNAALASLNLGCCEGTRANHSRCRRCRLVIKAAELAWEHR